MYCRMACLKNENEGNNKSLYCFVFLRLSRANSTAIHEKHILLTLERVQKISKKGKYLKKYIKKYFKIPCLNICCQLANQGHACDDGCDCRRTGTGVPSVK
jgi:hypothetical protein